MLQTYYQQIWQISRKFGKLCFFLHVLDLHPRSLHPRLFGSKQDAARCERTCRVLRRSPGCPPALGNFARGLFESFFCVARARFAENCGGSDLCLKTTHKFCGALRNTAKFSKISRNPQQMQKRSLNVQRAKFPNRRDPCVAELLAAVEGAAPLRAPARPRAPAPNA